jgi:hypothetical protein
VTSAGVVRDVGDDAADGACGEDRADDSSGADVEAGVSREVGARSAQASPMELTNANLADFMIPTRSSIPCAAPRDGLCMVVAAREKVTVVVTAHDELALVLLLLASGHREPG